MRILILTQWFDPEPTFKGLLFARKLVAAGHQVEVITGFPNYPSGKLYPGFRQGWFRREVMEGVHVVRCPLYVSHDASALRRLLNYFSFALSASLYGIFAARKADILYVYHPPMTVGLAGALIGLFRRTPFVYDVQDLWPDTLRATGMISNTRALNLVGKCCNWIYRRAAHVVVLSPGFRRLLAERGVPDSKLSIIYNWCDEQSLQSPSAGNSALGFMDGRFNVVFAGNVGRAQAMSGVLKAAQLVALSDSKVQFVIVGGGLEVGSMKSLAQELKLDNVRFMAQVPMAEIGSVLGHADALLVHLCRDPLFAITIPSKTQAYMAVGKPLIMAVEGDAAALVKRANAGITAMPEDPQSIAAAVLTLAAMTEEQRVQLGTNAARFYANELALSIGVARFIELFESVADKSTDIDGVTT